MKQGGRRVMVVSDDERVQDWIRLCLPGVYEVLIFPGAAPFLDAVRRYAPDIIVLDDDLADAEARELQGMLRADMSFSRVPVLRLLGESESSAPGLLIRNGPDAALARPFEPQVVLAAIRRIVPPPDQGAG